ncbi:MAG: hypothetical protein IAE82_05495 [Opitutaceae bacterium]|nr:hypothetical protein [Opitutaceae bacterium]
MSRAEKVCWIVAAIGVACVAAPFVFEESLEPLGDLRWVGVLLGALIAPTAAISSFLFRGRAKGRASLLDDKSLLAHWTFPAETWAGFVGEDDTRERRAKWRLFAIIAFWCVLFAIAFPLFDPEDGWWVSVVMAGVLVVLALVIVVGSSARTRRLGRNSTEARIGPDGLLLAGELHLWRGWGARLEGVDVVTGHPPCLEITYSTPAKNQRQITTVRVPVPAGCDAEAAEVAARLIEKIG